MKTCPIYYCSCTLLENNRNYCSFLFLFIYLFLEELLIFKWHGRNTNKPIPGWVTDWKSPCWGCHKDGAVSFKPGNPEGGNYLLYLFVKLCPQLKLCYDKTNVSDKPWVLVFLCLGQQELGTLWNVILRRSSVSEVESAWLLCRSKYPGTAPSWAGRTVGMDGVGWTHTHHHIKWKRKKVSRHVTLQTILC